MADKISYGEIFAGDTPQASLSTEEIISDKVVLSEWVRSNGGSTLVIGEQKDFNPVLYGNILQRNSSYIIIDPDGEYHEKTHGFLESFGYKVIQAGENGASYNIFCHMDTFGIRDFCGNFFAKDDIRCKAMEVILRFCFYKIPAEKNSLSSIKNLLMMYKGKLLDAVAELKEASCDETAFHMVLMLNENTLWSCITPLFKIDEETADKFMEQSDFSPSDLHTEKIAFYFDVSALCRGAVASAFIRDLMNFSDGNISVFFSLGYLPGCVIQNPDFVFQNAIQHGISLYSYAEGLSDISAFYDGNGEKIADDMQHIIYVRSEDDPLINTLQPKVRSALTKNEMKKRPEGKCIVFSKGMIPVFDDVFKAEVHPLYYLLQNQKEE